MTPGRVLHLLSQRPLLTGSGVTLDRLVREAAAAGWSQHVVVGAPANEPVEVGGLAAGQVDAVRFETTDLPFPVPGMSDVMPYRSSVWSSLDDAQWSAYRAAWTGMLRQVTERFTPDVVHAHHVWAVSALAREVFPEVRIVTHCHATGLRQMKQCPSRAGEIIERVRGNDAFAVLTEAMGVELQQTLSVPAARVAVVGAGYRDDVFHPGPGRRRDGGRLLYVGKLARAKGVDSLLDAFVLLASAWPSLRLEIAGAGVGDEADRLRARVAALGPAVALHGQLGQPELADLMRGCDVVVLPSFYEGLPLVLVEAAACGCRLVATDLAAVREVIAPALGEWMTVVPLPPMAAIDRPEPAALDAFAHRLAVAMRRALAPLPDARCPVLSGFTWRAVFRRVEALWSGRSVQPSII